MREARLREFTDPDGQGWQASIEQEGGTDYKGRFYLVLVCEDAPDVKLALEDVRWNSDQTARRTLETMSDVELRRRLRSALGRSSVRGG